MLVLSTNFKKTYVLKSPITLGHFRNKWFIPEISEHFPKLSRYLYQEHFKKIDGTFFKHFSRFRTLYGTFWQIL